MESVRSHIARPVVIVKRSPQRGGRVFSANHQTIRFMRWATFNKVIFDIIRVEAGQRHAELPLRTPPSLAWLRYMDQAVTADRRVRSGAPPHQDVQGTSGGRAPP